MARRVWARPRRQPGVAAITSMPASSGPRWRRAPCIRTRSAGRSRPGSVVRMPAIPHMQAVSLSHREEFAKGALLAHDHGLVLGLHPAKAQAVQAVTEAEAEQENVQKVPERPPRQVAS